MFNILLHNLLLMKALQPIKRTNQSSTNLCEMREVERNVQIDFFKLFFCQGTGAENQLAYERY